MTDTGAYRALDTGTFERLDDVELQRTTRDEGQGPGTGIEYDEYGNERLVPAPARSLGRAGVLARLLNDNSFELSPEEQFGMIRGLKQNPLGLTQGFDPYDTGLLPKKERKKRKNLRALSAWIQQKKQLASS